MILHSIRAGEKLNFVVSTGACDASLRAQRDYDCSPRASRFARVASDQITGRSSPVNW